MNETTWREFVDRMAMIERRVDIAERTNAMLVQRVLTLESINRVTAFQNDKLEAELEKVSKQRDVLSSALDIMRQKIQTEPLTPAPKPEAKGEA